MNRIRQWRNGCCVIFCLFSFKGMATSLLLESPAFQNNQFIPKEYTCEGANMSPPLTWKDGPSDAKSYVLTMEDPDAPNGNWVHWVWYNIPATVDHLDEHAALPQDAISGQNSWSKQGYGGPCPPQGVHRYVFYIYALDTQLKVDANATRDEIINVMQNHILEQSDLTGLYGNQ